MGNGFSIPYFIDNAQYFMNGSNVNIVPFQDAFAPVTHPVFTSVAPINGYDWTKPYPGTALSGYNVTLSIGQEMKISENIAQNATTLLSSLTFGTPATIMNSQTQPKAMDSSWFVCRHVFISTKPEAKAAVDGGKQCSFLPSACQNDLRTNLTKGWGTWDTQFMCGALAFDPIPQSCVNSFGYARQDVMGFNSTFLANTTLAPAQVSSAQQRYSWRIGTGYHEPYDPKAFAMAANRTYLVATVWGYGPSARSASVKVPDVSFACLSGGSPYIPQPPPILNSTATGNSSSTAKVTTSSTGSTTRPATTTITAKTSTK